MKSIAYALPLKPGAEKKGLELVRHLTEGETGAGYHDRRKAHGLQRVKVWRQSVPADMVIIYLEAEDSALDAMRKRSESQDDFWNQLETSLEEISGTHPDEVSAKPPQLLFDWHHERGHSRTHHPV